MKKSRSPGADLPVPSSSLASSATPVPSAILSGALARAAGQAVGAGVEAGAAHLTRAWRLVASHQRRADGLFAREMLGQLTERVGDWSPLPPLDLTKGKKRPPTLKTLPADGKGGSANRKGAKETGLAR